MDVISYNIGATANGRIESFIENPDSTSGIVTVPKVIEAGENVTIPAGRVAVLPNVQVDGVLNIEGDVFIPSGATFGDLESQIALKANTTDVYNKTEVDDSLSLKANMADLKEIGVGQTWQNVTASRSVGVTYTNTTGKPIQVIITNKAGATNVDFSIKINGVAIALFVIGPQSTSNQFGSLTAIIPNNSTYSTESYNSSVLHSWRELR